MWEELGRGACPKWAVHKLLVLIMLFLCVVTKGGLFGYHGGEAGEGI